MTNNPTPEVLTAVELVKRLREPANWLKQAKGEHYKDVVSEYDKAPFEAADMIETLTYLQEHAYKKGREDERKKVIEWVVNKKQSAQDKNTHYSHTKYLLDIQDLLDHLNK